MSKTNSLTKFSTQIFGKLFLHTELEIIMAGRMVLLSFLLTFIGTKDMPLNILMILEMNKMRFEAFMS